MVVKIKYMKGAKFNIKNASGSVNKNATTDGNGNITRFLFLLVSICL